MKSGILIVSIIIGMFLFNSCEKEITLMESNEVQTKYDTLNVSSNPAGACVYLNGKNTGYKTPCTIKWIEIKDLIVTFKLPPFCDGGKLVSADSIHYPLYYDFLADDRNFGAIDCSSNPSGADIYLNRENLNRKTPSTIEKLRPGNYAVHYKLKDHRADSTILEVNARNYNTDYKNVKFIGNMIDTSVFVDYTRETTIRSCTKIYIDNLNRLWFFSPERGVFLYVNNVFKKMFSPFNLSSTTSILQDSKGNIWFATQSGLLRISPDGMSKLYEIGPDIPLISYNIKSVCEDSNQNLWVATGDGLLRCNLNSQLKYDDWQFFHPSDYPAMLNYNITNVCATSDGSVWASLYGYGVIRYKNGRWVNYTLGNSTIPDHVIRFMFSKNNAVYFVSYSSTFLFSNEQWKKLPIQGSASINGIYVDPENNLFVGYSSSITILKNNGISENINTSVQGLPKPLNINSIGVDGDKNVWLATQNYGIVKYKYFKK